MNYYEVKFPEFGELLCSKKKGEEENKKSCSSKVKCSVVQAPAASAAPGLPTWSAGPRAIGASARTAARATAGGRGGTSPADGLR